MPAMASERRNTLITMQNGSKKSKGSIELRIIMEPDAKIATICDFCIAIFHFCIFRCHLAWNLGRFGHRNYTYSNTPMHDHSWTGIGRICFLVFR